MISRIWRPIKEGFLGVFRHGSMSSSSCIAVTVTLGIISLFLLFSVNVGQFTQGIEQSVEISATVDYSYESAQQEDRISLAIQSIDGVDTVTYYTKDEEFQYYLDSFSSEETKEAFRPFEGENNPMHDTFYVTVKDGQDLEAAATAIQAIEGIDSVNFGGASAVKLMRVLRSIRFAGWFVALLTSLLAVLLISNTIKVTITARADEIAIMRNVGARNGFIRSPFVVEGIIIGALGAIIPVAVMIYLYRSLYEFTGGYLISQMFTLVPPDTILPYAVVILAGIGILVGLLGSFFSVTRYLRWKR